MVTADEIEDWLRGLKPIPQRNDEAPQPLTGKSRDHYRRAIATLFKFGEARGYPARGLGEMDCVTLAKVEHNAVEIFTPAEMRLVPMEANLRAWMEPHRKPSGPICEYANVPNQLSGGWPVEKYRFWVWGYDPNMSWRSRAKGDNGGGIRTGATGNLEAAWMAATSWATGSALV